jgi:uncharacterized protein
MYERFRLELMVNHACNLRCRYCYTGTKFNRPMRLDVGRRAIERAAASVLRGGTLELDFCGGEPLIEAKLMQELIGQAQQVCAPRGVKLATSLTTNATLGDDAAWAVMVRPDVRLTISHDGKPEVHDFHRVTIDGAPTSDAVLETMGRLMAAGKPFVVAMVVRPDTLGQLPAGIRFLWDMGVRWIEPALDLWTAWSDAEIAALEQTVAACAQVWADGLPGHGISWFDDKAMELAGIARPATARCAFGDGQVAVAPSGRMYPCQRLIGTDDEADNPIRLAGNVSDGGADLVAVRQFPPRFDPTCDQCPIQRMCNTTCRCANFVRSANVQRPDWLLCAWNQACLTATRDAMAKLAATRRTQGGVGRGNGV